MIQATLTLTVAQLNTAVAEWLDRQGIAITDRFSVEVKTLPGDRPFDTAHTTITVTGIVIGGGGA